jgi:hypothetical protein
VPAATVDASADTTLSSDVGAEDPGLHRNEIDVARCPCGSNCFISRTSDKEEVVCEDCGSPLHSLGTTKRAGRWLYAAIISAKVAFAPRAPDCRNRASDAGLRHSIAETDRLVLESDKMLRRHHKECDDDVA